MIKKLSWSLDEKHRLHLAFQDISSVSRMTAYKNIWQRVQCKLTDMQDYWLSSKLMAYNPLQAKRKWRICMMHWRQCMTHVAHEAPYFPVQMKVQLGSVFNVLHNHSIIMRMPSTDYHSLTNSQLSMKQRKQFSRCNKVSVLEIC